MEHGTDAIQCDADARSPSLRNFRAVVQEHCFHVRPGDVGAFVEDRRQHTLVFTHKTMISKNDINGCCAGIAKNSVNSFLDFRAYLL